MNKQEVQQWADDVSVYLHELAFGNTDYRGRMLLPPVLGDSRVLHDKEHTSTCSCPICMGRA